MKSIIDIIDRSVTQSLLGDVSHLLLHSSSFLLHHRVVEVHTGVWQRSEAWFTARVPLDVAGVVLFITTTAISSSIIPGCGNFNIICSSWTQEKASRKATIRQIRKQLRRGEYTAVSHRHGMMQQLYRTLHCSVM